MRRRSTATHQRKTKEVDGYGRHWLVTYDGTGVVSVVPVRD